MPLTLPAAPSPPTLSNPGTFETDTSAFLAWMAAVATAMSGSVLLLGDFGLGGAGNVLPPGNNANNAIAPGLYSMTPTTANGPTGNTAALRVERSYNVVLQIASTSIGVYRRRSSDSGATWSAWVLDMERGSNGNGDYVRFADGTQICHINTPGLATPTGIGAIFGTTSEFVGTFPASFSGGADSISAVATTRSATRWANVRSTSNAAYALRQYSYTSDGTLIPCNVVAVGRWFT